MLNKFYLAILILAALLQFSCSQKLTSDLKSKQHNYSNFKVDSIINSSISFDSLFAEKVNFRYVHSGQVHSLRANIYFIKDSVIKFDLFTTFNINILSFYADKNKIILSEKSNHTQIIKNYNELSELLGLPLSLYDLQNFVFGQKIYNPNQNPNYNITSQNNILVIENIHSNLLLKVYHNYLLPYNKLLYCEVQSTEGPKLLTTHYTVNETNSGSLPKLVNIELFHLSKTIEIEFELKNYVIY
jgi:hypothetical protein